MESRYDNDHPGLAVLMHKPFRHRVQVAVQVYGNIQGGDKFEEAQLAIIDPKRAQETLFIEVNPGKKNGPVPNGLIGLSQGGGMSDYEDATAEKLKAGGFKWFRMDNVLTSVLKNEKTD